MLTTLLLWAGLSLAALFTLTFAYVFLKTPRSVSPKTLPDGRQLIAFNSAEANALYQQMWVDKTYFQHGIKVKKGDLIFDVGSNVGSFLVYLARDLGHLGLRVHAFEPVSVVRDALKQNLSMVQNDEGIAIEATIHPYGLSSSAEPAVQFDFCPLIPFSSSRYSFSDMMAKYGRKDLGVVGFLQALMGDLVSTGLGIPVISNTLSPGLAHSNPVVKFLAAVVSAVYIVAINTARILTTSKVTCELKKSGDIVREVLRSGEEISLLKVDVEGAEEDVFNGLSDEDLSRVRQTVIEVQGKPVVESLKARLEKNGFSVVVDQEPFGILDAGNFYNIYAVRK